MESKQTLREIRNLKIYLATSTLLFISFVLFSFTGQTNQFEEISVERINIVKEDGTLDMVITNANRVPDPIMAGKVVGKRDGAANPAFGIYNNEGDEVGGWTFGVNDYNGQKVAKTALLFDQYKNDEVMQLFYQEVIGGGSKIAGLEIKDRPSNVSIIDLADMFQKAQEMEEGPEKDKTMQALQKRSQNGEFGGSRLFVGAVNGLPVIQLNDDKGKTKIRMLVDTSGNPKLQFLNDDGEVILSLPESK